MKIIRLFAILLIIALNAGFISCSNNDDDTFNSNSSEETVTVSFALQGNFTEISEELLTRSTEIPSLQIQVHQLNINTNKYEPYAYGTFDNTSNITITLKKNTKYNFTVCLYYDYIDKYIFSLEENPKADIGIINSFVYSNKILHISRSGTAASPVSRSTLNYAHNMIPCKSFHGILTEYIPDGNNIVINMLNTTVGLDVIVDGMTEGKIENKNKNMGSIPFTIEYPNNKYSTICTNYSDAVFLLDHFYSTLSISYYNSKEEETVIINEDIVMQINHKKTIKINLSPISSDEMKGKIYFNMENSPMINDEMKEYDCKVR